MRKPAFCICDKKVPELRGTAKQISAFVFATRLGQSLYFLYTKFQASSHLLWLYLVGNPEDRFSHNEAQLMVWIHILKSLKLFESHYVLIYMYQSLSQLLVENYKRAVHVFCLWLVL